MNTEINQLRGHVEYAEKKLREAQAELEGVTRAVALWQRAWEISTDKLNAALKQAEVKP